MGVYDFLCKPHFCLTHIWLNNLQKKTPIINITHNVPFCRIRIIDQSISFKAKMAYIDIVPLKDSQADIKSHQRPQTLARLGSALLSLSQSVLSFLKTHPN